VAVVVDEEEAVAAEVDFQEVVDVVVLAVAVVVAVAAVEEVVSVAEELVAVVAVAEVVVEDHLEDLEALKVVKKL